MNEYRSFLNQRFFEYSSVSAPADTNALIPGEKARAVIPPVMNKSPKNLWDDLVTSGIMGKVQTFIMSEPEYVGVIPVRREIPALPYRYSMFSYDYLNALFSTPTTEFEDPLQNEYDEDFEF